MGWMGVFSHGANGALVQILSRQWFVSATVLLSAAAFAACGGNDRQDATSTRATGTPTLTSEATATPAVTGDDNSGKLICEEPAPVQVEIGSTVTGDNYSFFTACFSVELSTDLTQLTITLSDLTDDLDLGVSYGDIVNIQYPGVGEYWRSGEDGALTETVTIENAEAGIYWISVGPGGYQDSSSFTLSVSGIE